METSKNTDTDTRPDSEELKELLDDDGISSMPGQNMEQSSPDRDSRSLEFLYDVPLQVSVEVGRSRILLRDLLKMGEGYVIELDKIAGDPLDLYVNSRLIARGEAVMVGEKFGIRLTDVVSTSDRLEKLG